MKCNRCGAEYQGNFVPLVVRRRKYSHRYHRKIRRSRM